MDFKADQRLAITKVIIEVTISSGGLGTVHDRSYRRKRFEDSAMIYYERDMAILLNNHNSPLYVIALFVTWNWSTQ